VHIIATHCVDARREQREKERERDAYTKPEVTHFFHNVLRSLLKKVRVS
jgi:alpha/beta superfamily hydrolase